jgi:EmrB/QacA subfamily drug resistance transporter
LFLSALILVGGALGDSVGRRLMFLIGAGAFTAASIGCGLSSTAGQLIAWRCLQGIGAAFLVPSSLAIISATFDEKSRGRAIGTWSGFTAITTALGPVLGGWLVEHGSWHWVFYINVPLAAAVIAISLRHIPETRSAAATKIDWLGATLVTLGLGGLVYGFIESATLGWHHPFVVGSLIGGLAAIVAFGFAEAHERAPMVPLTLFQSRKFTGANLLTLFLYSALGVFFFLFPMNLIQVQRYSATATGAAALPLILLMFLLSRWSGGLVARYGPRNPLIIGPLIAAVGFFLFARPSIGGHYLTTYFPAFVVLGIGLSVSVAPLTTVVMSSVAQDHAGTASGINNAVARVAGVLAIAILGVVTVTAFSHHLQQSIAGLNLAPDILHSLQSNAIRLAGLEIPDAGGNALTLIRAAIASAFVFAFRVIMLICAGLSVTSAAVAWRMI